jgi:hypothetical protein
MDTRELKEAFVNMHTSHHLMIHLFYSVHPLYSTFTTKKEYLNPIMRETVTGTYR